MKLEAKICFSIVLGAASLCLLLWRLGWFAPQAEEEAGSVGKPSSEEQAVERLEGTVADLLEELLTDFPTDAACVDRALALPYLYHPTKAAALLQYALKYNPDNPILCRMMAEMSFDDGDYEQAITYFRKVSGRFSDTWEIQNRIAESLIALGRYQEVVDALEARVEDPASPGRSHYLLGQAFSQLGNYTRAKECYERALKTNPQNAQLAYALGNAYVRLGQPEAAAPYLEAFRQKQADRQRSALEAASRRGEPELHHSVIPDPWRRGEVANMLSTLSARGSELYRANRQPERAEQILQQAQAAFREAIELAPDQPDSYREFARLVLLTGDDPAKAVRLAEQAVALESSALNYLTLGHAYRAAAEDRKAIAALRRAAEIEPEWFAPKNDLAWILATDADSAIRQPAEAVRLARQAAVLTRHRNPYVRNTLAAAYASAGQFARAAKVGESALELARATHEEALAADALEQLELYRRGVPYRSSDRTIQGTTFDGFRSAVGE